MPTVFKLQYYDFCFRLPSGDAIHLSDLPVIKETIASKLITTPVASASRTNRGATFYVRATSEGIRPEKNKISSNLPALPII
jgi:hypothetical protein